MCKNLFSDGWDDWIWFEVQKKKKKSLTWQIIMVFLETFFYYKYFCFERAHMLQGKPKCFDLRIVIIWFSNDTSLIPTPHLATTSDNGWVDSSGSISLIFPQRKKDPFYQKFRDKTLNWNRQFRSLSLILSTSSLKVAHSKRATWQHLFALQFAQTFFCSHFVQLLILPVRL